MSRRRCSVVIGNLKSDAADGSTPTNRFMVDSTHFNPLRSSRTRSSRALVRGRSCARRDRNVVHLHEYRQLSNHGDECERSRRAFPTRQWCQLHERHRSVERWRLGADDHREWKSRDRVSRRHDEYDLWRQQPRHDTGPHSEQSDPGRADRKLRGHPDCGHHAAIGSSGDPLGQPSMRQQHRRTRHNPGRRLHPQLAGAATSDRIGWMPKAL